jgi:hypothetical protein
MLYDKISCSLAQRFLALLCATHTKKDDHHATITEKDEYWTVGA